jgi:pimeloyl-ACP methyl ester carboxylesterase
MGRLAAAVCLAATALPGAADTLVLIPGYLSDGQDWRQSGIADSLRRAGWGDGGNLFLHRGRPFVSGGGPPRPQRFYTLDLESEAPLLYQEQQLTAYLSALRERHPGEPLILAGHSAGGVLGRLQMVRNPEQPVSALITIASPHLGTESAELGLQAGHSPLAWLTGLVGADTLNRSQGLFFDLARERPGNLLFWLNRQQHPEARYVSVVRNGEDSLFGDLVVPEWSQDMNRVQALYGRALRIEAGGGHGLSEDDARLLVRILARLTAS